MKQIIRDKLLAFFQMMKCVVVYRNVKIPVLKQQEESIIVQTSDVAQQREQIPPVVWLYWHDPELPFFVRKIIEHNKTVLPEYEFRLLDRLTVENYLPELTLPDEVGITHRTDLIRLQLLYHYGGVWMDATVILNQDFGWIEELSKQRCYDLIAYYRERSTVNYAHPVVESWFLASPSGTEFMKAWAEEFGQISVLGGQYYDQLIARPDYDILRQKIDRPSYLLVYLAEQIASRAVGLNGYFKKCEDSALAIQEHFGWDNYAINYVFTQLENKTLFLPIIKLTAGDRMLVDFMYKWGLLHKKSVLGKIVYGV